jgi:hypothetical protein
MALNGVTASAGAVSKSSPSLAMERALSFAVATYVEPVWALTSAARAEATSAVVMPTVMVTSLANPSNVRVHFSPGTGVPDKVITRASESVAALYVPAVVPPSTIEIPLTLIVPEDVAIKRTFPTAVAENPLMLTSEAKAVATSFIVSPLCTIYVKS